MRLAGEDVGRRGPGRGGGSGGPGWREGSTRASAGQAPPVGTLQALMVQFQGRCFQVGVGEHLLRLRAGLTVLLFLLGPPGHRLGSGFDFLAGTSPALFHLRHTQGRAAAALNFEGNRTGSGWRSVGTSGRREGRRGFRVGGEGGQRGSRVRHRVRVREGSKLMACRVALALHGRLRHFVWFDVLVVQVVRRGGDGWV